MACSKYISTKETTHAARVSRLLVDPCTDLFRDILRNHVTEIQFPAIILQERNNLNPILNKVQRETLYPKSGTFNGTYADFDLSLLYILLRNISGIPPHQKGWAKTPDPLDRSLSANIDRIREIRNTYCGHAARVSLTDVEFNKLWQDLTIIISELESSLPGGCTTYTDAAKVIKIVTMDPEQEKKFLDEIDKHHQTTDDLKGKITEVIIEQQRQGTEIEKVKLEQILQRTDFQSEQECQKKEIDDLSSNLSKLEKLSDYERQNIIENTSAVLNDQKNRKMNVRITGVQTTREKLRDNHIAILTGKTGTGKTTTAYQVMCEMADPSLESPDMPVLIKSPKQWDKVVNYNHQYLVYIDDIFGSTNLDPSALEKWKNQLTIMYACAKRGNVKVLFSLRRNVLDEARKFYLHPILDDENIVDISLEENFTMQEKADMLAAYEDNCSFKDSELFSDIHSDFSIGNPLNTGFRLSEHEKKVILSANPYYGFPLSCFQFFCCREFFKLGPSYFLNPDEKLFEAIENMRRSTKSYKNEKVKYCVLCYVLISGSIETNSLSNTLLKAICEKLLIPILSEIDLKDAINDLNGAYLSKISEKRYEFSHEAILETVLVSFGQLAPDMVIKHCSRRKLHELIRTESCIPKTGEVLLKIPIQYYEDLAQRLLRVDVGEREEFSEIRFKALDILQYPGCYDAAFASVFCNCKISNNLYPLFRELFKSGCTASFLMEKNNVLLQELLERYGPHRAFQAQKKSESIFTAFIKYVWGKLLYGLFHTNPVEEKIESDFEITIQDINEVLLQCLSPFYTCALSTVIPYICKYKSLSNLSSLLDIRLGGGVTFLHYCILYGLENLVDMMLEIQTPTKTEENWSCIHLAAYVGRPSLMQKFIPGGQDKIERTSEGYSALQTAFLGLRYGNQKVFYPSNKVNNASFFVGKSFYFSDGMAFRNVIDILLKEHVQCEIVDLYMFIDSYGNSIIHYLVMHNYDDVLDCLLKFDKTFVFQRNKSALPTAIHVAVYLGRPDMVRKLWTVGVRPCEDDISLMESFHEGERFCSNTISCVMSADLCPNVEFPIWNDGKKMINLKLKAIQNVKVTFGSTDDYQVVREFFHDELDD